MFKPTAILEKRSEARLRGWRAPAIGLLRDQTKRTDPLALAPAFKYVPHAEPRRGLPVETAHKMMGLPMSDILDMRGSRRTVEEGDVVQMARIPRYCQPELEELQLGIARQKQRIKRV
jgi:hypothetical protein